MIIVAREEGSDLITFIFEGADEASLIESAMANGCAEWVEAAERPAPGARLVAGLILPAVVDPDAHRRSMEISPRQLFIALASEPWSYITPEEAIAAATAGTMPAAVEAAMAGFDAAAQLAARVTWARMQVVLRLDPLVTALGASQGASDAELDDFFAFASGL